MPVAAKIDIAARIVRTTASGLLSRADFVTHNETTWCDEAIAGFDEIVDATSADAPQLSATDLAEIVNSGVTFDPNNEARLAVCVDCELAYGLGRMFSMMRETHTENTRAVKIFKDLETAEARIAEPRGLSS
ncbi:MAG: hypothetical protein ACI9BW_004144 [Gammaproteobacteria bacterium]|jgi:hypothetical protein